jgi:hypothetical protein
MAVARLELVTRIEVSGSIPETPREVRFRSTLPFGPSVARAHAVAVNHPLDSSRYVVPFARKFRAVRTAKVPLGVVAADCTTTERETTEPEGTVPMLSFTSSPEAVEFTRIGAVATATVDVAFPGNALKP